MRASAFGRTTGKTEQRQCPTCGVRVRHVELAYRSTSGVGTLWLSDHHHAPCGGVCVVGGEPARGSKTPVRVHFRRDCAACARLEVGMRISAQAGGAA